MSLTHGIFIVPVSSLASSSASHQQPPMISGLLNLDEPERQNSGSLGSGLVHLFESKITSLAKSS